jgi:DNA-binding SARP family transcriptional activator
LDTIRERSDEAAERQIDAFIERRSRKGETDPDEREDLWVESVRRFNKQQRRQIRAEWYGWHCDQAERHRRTLAALIARHEHEAEKLLEPEVPDDAA